VGGEQLISASDKEKPSPRRKETMVGDVDIHLAMENPLHLQFAAIEG
jgi:hypothetical protein